MVGVNGWALTTALPEAEDVQPSALVTVKVRVPVVILLKVAVVPVPVIVPPEETATVHDPVAGSPLKATLPVAVEQVGCVIAPTVGASGADGSLRLAFTPVADVHPLAVICKSVYVPAVAVMMAVPLATVTPAKLPEL